MLLPVWEYWEIQGDCDVCVASIYISTAGKKPVVRYEDPSGEDKELATPKGLKLVELNLRALPSKLREKYDSDGDGVFLTEDQQHIWCYADIETAAVIKDQYKCIEAAYAQVKKLVHA